MDSTSLTKPVDLQGLSLALAKTKADYEARINKVAVPPDWETGDGNSFAYILNKPAIRAGDGEGSIVEGKQDTNASIATILITGEAGAITYSYTTEDTTLPTTLTTNTSLYLAYGANSYRAVTIIDGENHTITFDKTFSNSALTDTTVTLYYRCHKAMGNSSHAEGYRTMAASSYSHAEGAGSMATYSGSHAEGSNTKALSTSAHSEGTGTLANALNAHAEGMGTIASGLVSHAEGNHTIASSTEQHVQGKYNIEDSNDTYAHIVGNGISESNRSNAHTLDWSGNAWYASKVSAGTVENPANPTANNDLTTKAYVDNATASITDEKLSTGTIGNNVYYPIVGTNTSSATTKYIDSTGLKYDATSSTNGYARLYLGNGTASGTEGSKYGRLMIYGTTAYAVTLDSGSPTENRTISLPNKNGTIALTSDVPTKVSDLTNDSGFITSYTETDPIFVASAAYGITSSDISNWNGKTSNAGTVTKITAGTGLSGGDITTSGTINHSNSVTAQNTQAIYPIKIDAQGHISEYGSAVTPLTASSTLDATKLSGTIPTACLPSYVDDVLEYTAKSSFPSTGESGKIYVDTTTNLTYRWSGSAYVEISTSLALGTTSSTAFRGDYGDAAYAHAVTNKGSAFVSGLYKITTNSEGHVTGATAVQKSDITELGIPGSDTSTLSGLSDTGVTSPTNGQMLVYNSTTSKWENATLSLGLSGNTIQLKQGSTVISSITLPVYNGGVSS